MDCRLDVGVAFGGLAFGAVLIGVSYIFCPGCPGGALEGGGPIQKEKE